MAARPPLPPPLRPLLLRAPDPPSATDRRLRDLLFLVSDLERDALRCAARDRERLAARFRLLSRGLARLRNVAPLERDRTHRQALLSGYRLGGDEVRGR